MRQLVRLILLAGALSGTLAGLSPIAALAQQSAPRAPFRILNQDRLLRGSQLGQHILARIHDAEQALQAENQRLFDQLASEEQALTDLRPTLSPEEFRTRADAFDAHVEQIRADRQRASDALTRQSETQAQHFFDAALPVLVQMMNDEGVIGLLKPDMLILGSDWLDITDEAISRLDAAYASGAISDVAAPQAAASPSPASPAPSSPAPSSPAPSSPAPSSLAPSSMTPAPQTPALRDNPVQPATPVPTPVPAPVPAPVLVPGSGGATPTGTP